jgi:hypothetical protein
MILSRSGLFQGWGPGDFSLLGGHIVGFGEGCLASCLKAESCSGSPEPPGTARLHGKVLNTCPCGEEQQRGQLI